MLKLVKASDDQNHTYQKVEDLLIYPVSTVSTGKEVHLLTSQMRILKSI